MDLTVWMQLKVMLPPSYYAVSSLRVTDEVKAQLPVAPGYNTWFDGGDDGLALQTDPFALLERRCFWNVLRNQVKIIVLLHFPALIFFLHLPLDITKGKGYTETSNLEM